MTANVIRIKWIDADACYKVSQPGWDGGNVVMEDDYIKLKAEFERLRAFISNPPRHKFWGAGEPDCPKEIKAHNGEIWQMRCKVCNQTNPRWDFCTGALNTRVDQS